MSPSGAQALLQWTRCWAAAIIPPSVAAIFLEGWCAPLNKAKGGIRPILLFEATLKLATGSVLERVQPTFAPRLLPTQFGCGIPAGAEVLLKTAQACSDAMPSSVFVASDVPNAFGTLKRTSAFQASISRAPALCPLLAQMWLHGPTKV